MADTDTKEAILIDPVIDLAERDATICKDLGLKLLYASKLDHLIFTNIQMQYANGYVPWFKDAKNMYHIRLLINSD